MILTDFDNEDFFLSTIDISSITFFFASSTHTKI